jgi:hypothetical protein
MKKNKHATKKLKQVPPLTLAESVEYCELCSERLEHGDRGAMGLSPEKQKRFKELDAAHKAGLASGDRPATATGKSKPRFDLEKFGMQYCSGADAERSARKAVLNTLKIRAKTENVMFNENGRIGPEIAPIRWLFPQLKQLKNEFATEIAEELDELKKPHAKREILVGMIWSQVFCVRACVTLLIGSEESMTEVPVAVASSPLTYSETQEYQELFTAWTKNGGEGAELMSVEKINRFSQLSDRICAAQQAA